MTGKRPAGAPGGDSYRADECDVTIYLWPEGRKPWSWHVHNRRGLPAVERASRHGRARSEERARQQAAKAVAFFERRNAKHTPLTTIHGLER